MAVAVIVGPGGTGAESAAADASLFCHVLKFAIPQIAIQNVAAVARDEKIQPPVVVEISYGNAHPPSEPRQARSFGDVFESPIWLLVIQSDHRVAATLAIAINGGTVNGKNVELAVVVAIKQPNPAAHGLDNVTFVWRRNVGNGEPASVRDVFKHRAAIGNRLFLRARERAKKNSACDQEFS